MTGTTRVPRTKTTKKMLDQSSIPRPRDRYRSQPKRSVDHGRCLSVNRAKRALMMSSE